MLESLASFLMEYGYSGLFLASFLSSTILPFGSEGILILLINKKFDLVTVVLVASCGNFLGACTSYYLGLKGRGLVEKYLRINRDDIKRAEKIFSKYGAFVLLFTWLPFIGDALTVAGGLLRFKFWTFSILVFTGKLLRYLAVAYFVTTIIS